MNAFTTKGAGMKHPNTDPNEAVYLSLVEATEALDYVIEDLKRDPELLTYFDVDRQVREVEERVNEINEIHRQLRGG